VAAGLLLGGCGGGGGGDAGPLTWHGKPRLFAPKDLPRDRVLTGRVTNRSLRRVDLTVGDLRLRDEDGHRVAGSATFLYAFVHGLWPPTRQPKQLPDAELLRTGRIARILPGKSAPITVSWRTGPGQGRPVRLDYGRGSLEIPAR
jgi:hypothetical protein